MPTAPLPSANSLDDLHAWEEVADPADLDAVFAVEELTNQRIRTQVGELSLVPEADRISGPGTSPIMAAFTHPNTAGSRFSPGTYGVYYAAGDEQTAVRFRLDATGEVQEMATRDKLLIRAEDFSAKQEAAR